MTAHKRIFMTGANGHIGSVITELAIADGFAVHGLSRTEASDSRLRALGAVPVRGNLTALDVLRRESADADVVIHLASAYVFGGSPYESVRLADCAAVDAIADGLQGTNKPLVTTSGTLVVDADPSGEETTEMTPAQVNPDHTRYLTELHSLGLKERGIRVTAVRCAPYVYGRGRSGVARFMAMAAGAGAVTVVDGGRNRTTVVHVDDAARLFLLAAEKGRAGEVYNASASTEVTSQQMAEAMADVLGVPVRDITMEDARAQLGPMVSYFLSVENRASGAKAREELGWRPMGLGVLDDIRDGSYRVVGQAPRTPAE